MRRSRHNPTALTQCPCCSDQVEAPKLTTCPRCESAIPSRPPNRQLSIGRRSRLRLSAVPTQALRDAS